jgi:CTP-dependent riboflavin kinase
MGKALEKFKRKLGTVKAMPAQVEIPKSTDTSIPDVAVRKRSYAKIIAAVDLELERRWIQNNGREV